MDSYKNHRDWMAFGTGYNTYHQKLPVTKNHHYLMLAEESLHIS